MDEFPDPDEDFDLEHEDEYEVLRELEEAEQQSKVSQPIAQPKNTNCANKNVQQCFETKSVHHSIDLTNTTKQPKSSGTVNIAKPNQNSVPISSLSKESQSVLHNLADILSQNTQEINGTTEKSNKRTAEQLINELGGQIDDQDFLDDFGTNNIDAPNIKRPRWDNPEELIKIILERRKQNVDIDNLKNVHRKTVNPGAIKPGTVSRRVPTWNFVAVTKYDTGERFYVKFLERKKFIPEKKFGHSGLLSTPIQKLKDEAEAIILNSKEKEAILSSQVLDINGNKKDCSLWVDKYRPKRYFDLLTEETVNKPLLYWIKLWDKIVFDRDPTIRARKVKTFQQKRKFNKFKNEDVPDHDSKGFPTKRIALLSGPPGLGKTTLAHIVAKHAGYNIVEVNASDDRGPEAFREALLSSTQMRAVVDQERRPNCLILDEIDGAPAASIDLLLKFIYGKLAPKGAKSKEKKKQGDGCRRPIICICNDVYTPSLRPLRTIALTISVPEVSPTTLADRLQVIANKENLDLDSRTLLNLAERSGCDIRACLGILQYTGGGKKMLQDITLGLKDTKTGLFEAWKAIFRVPFTRTGPLSVNERGARIMKLIQQSEPEKLVQGIFHNYPEVCKDKIVSVAESCDWFNFYDIVNHLILERQCWMLYPYLNYAFVNWHLNLAISKPSKIMFPSIIFEINQKAERSTAILMQVKKNAMADIMALITDIVPYLPDLLTPKLRSVNSQLYSEKEKSELYRLIDIMLHYGLTYVQEKKIDSVGYEYHLDPNIWNIGVFENCKVRKPLPYAVKQIVSQELEVERLRRLSILTSKDNKTKSEDSKSANDSLSPSISPVPDDVDEEPENETTEPSKSKEIEDKVPNHLRQLNPIELKSSPKPRNFFHKFQQLGREKLQRKLDQEKKEAVSSGITAEKPVEKTDLDKKKQALKCDVWYQFREGYSNAVRRTVYMKDIL